MPKPFTVAEVREAFLAFFVEKGCVRYASAALVPENDPTTLFTVAGMSQFKDMFLGRGTHPFTRATTVQKCIRTNDILNVGRTARHHTFFEMLGNFSFNDYFKKEAIHWAWEFLTQRLALDPDRLSVSVHQLDDEAYRIWKDEIGLPATRIFKLGDSDNFWPANAPKEGPEGPGGCCSEIFWDHRINADPQDNLTSSTGRFVEIWNLVFPEFNVRKPHGDGSPNLEKLGRRNIDTGSGLERVAAVMQGVYNNFDIDVFQTIIGSVCAISGCTYDRSAPLGAKTPAAEANALIRRIADHVRAVTFCVADGALPANTDRGYIVRRLIRRATLDIDRLGVDTPRLHEVVPAVVAAMGKAYPEVVRRRELAEDTFKAEEALFRRTLRKGLDLFQRALERQRGGAIFSGDDAFELVTTNGFPKEVIAELAGNEGLGLDEARFTVRWDEHIRVSTGKTAEVFTTSALLQAKPQLGVTPFVGYSATECSTDLVLLEVDGGQVEEAALGAKVRFALAKTPFYGESGGQVGDRGRVLAAAGAQSAFEIRVDDTQKDEGLVIHSGEVVAGSARPGPVRAVVDLGNRRATTRHHSATHLLHAALAQVLGAQVEQQGSKVEPGQLRFDFNHPQAPTREQLTAIETWVSAQIKAALPVQTQELPIAEARLLGAKAQFGEKYGATVRVLSMGATAVVSRELCGGCHVANTGDITAFRIVKEEATAAGIRRITAVAGQAALNLAAEEQTAVDAIARCIGVAAGDPRQVEELARLFKVPLKEVPARVEALARDVGELATRMQTTIISAGGDLLERVQQLVDEQKRLRKLEDGRKSRAAAGAIDQVLTSEVVVDGLALIAAQIDGLDGKALRTLGETLRNKRPQHAALLISVHDGKVMLVASASPDAVAKGLSAGAIAAAAAAAVGGKGGGRDDFAQAGGKDAAAVPGALAAMLHTARARLAGSGAA